MSKLPVGPLVLPSILPSILLTILLTILLVAWMGTLAVHAQEVSSSNQKVLSGSTAASGVTESVELENEKAVTQFVKEHQPELADLLDFLKSKKPKDYNEAMRESRKVRERLLGIKDRDQELYEVELAIWKNSAQIRLLVASVSARSNKLSNEDRDRLSQLVTRENELSIQRLKLEKVRLESRLNQMSQQLERREEQADSLISKSMKNWETRIERAGKPKKKDASSP